MTNDWFSKLKEYDSLLKMSLKTENNINEEESRLAKLQDHKSIRLSQISDLQKEYSEVGQIYHDKEKELNTNENQAKNLQSLSGDETKISHFLKKVSEIENELMELLDRQEQIQTEIEEHRTFLKGLEQTVSKITEEVGQNIKNFNNEFKQYELRMNLIFDELPTNFQSALKRVLSKKLAHGPFTKNENGSCYFCRFKISKNDESEIDVQRVLKHCPQCSRIFLPYSS